VRARVVAIEVLLREGLGRPPQAEEQQCLECKTLERRLISQLTNEALAVKRTAGVRLGRPPTLPHAVIRRIQGQRARGDSYRKVAED
jgi:hypothetical protein